MWPSQQSQPTGMHSADSRHQGNDGVPESGDRHALTTSTRSLRPRVWAAMRRFLVPTLLLLFALQVILTARQMSPAYDEVANLPTGYVFLKTGQWSLIPAHAPLIFALSALPLLAINPRLDLNDPSFKLDPPNAWNVGLSFLALNNDDDRLFFWGRLPVMLLSLLLAYFVYRWANELYGGGAGLMALLLYAFCPTTIAHSGLTSYDIGLSCFFTLSLYWLWRFMALGSWHHLLWTGLLLGCALASKTPAVILPPLFVALMLLAVWWYPRAEGADAVPLPMAPSLSFPLAAHAARERLLLSLGGLMLIFLMAFGVLYTVYLFPKDPLFYVRAVLLAPRLHPPTYPYYLMGQFRVGGWWYYFLAAYAIKTPIPMLLLIPLALWHWYRQRSGWFHEVFLLLPALAFVILISALADPLGVRYLLPIYPLLFIFVSRTAPLFTRKTAGAVAGIVLAAWYLSTPIRFHPDYLSYFNELIGGPKHGIDYLDDSNIEWGQHLKRLKHYLDDHKFDKVKLLYFTTGRPGYYGIRAEPMQLADLARTPEPGIYIIGAYELVRARGYYGIDWLKKYEVMDVIGNSVYVFRVR
jgi:hypothetical protein